ncbi:sugar transferase [Bacteroides uniformis]|nr:sugar transferase [Bacteroides uniformis]
MEAYLRHPFAVAVLIALSPIFIVTAIAIRMESKGKVIYKSQRVGSNYQIFNFHRSSAPCTPMQTSAPKELNALNQYKMEEELTDEQLDIRFDD